MFALLGDVQFDLITYFDGFESQFGADFAEHALIEGKPRLQFIGDKLDENPHPARLPPALLRPRGRAGPS